MKMTKRIRGSQIKRLLRENGVTQKALAERLDTDEGWVSSTLNERKYASRPNGASQTTLQRMYGAALELAAKKTK